MKEIVDKGISNTIDNNLSTIKSVITQSEKEQEKITNNCLAAVQKATKDFKIIDEKVTAIGNSIKEVFYHIKNESENIPIPHSKAPKPKKSEYTKPVKSVLFVGDSIAHNVDFDFIEKKIDYKLIVEKAYSAAHDKSAKYPDLNFTDVVRNKLNETSSKILILHGGSVDITNMDAQTDPLNKIEYLKQTAAMSSQNIFKTAEDSLKSNPNLEKVVIMERIDRYDTVESDPYRLKANLSKFSNLEYQRLLNESTLREKIIIHQNNLEITGSTFEQRYGSITNSKFDGIHTTAVQGKIDLTQNLLKALYDANLLRYKYQYIPTAIKGTNSWQQSHLNRNLSQNNKSEIRGSTPLGAFWEPSLNKSKVWRNNDQSNYIASQNKAAPNQWKYRQQKQLQKQQQQVDSKGFSFTTPNKFAPLAESSEWSDQVDYAELQDSHPTDKTSENY